MPDDLGIDIGYIDVSDNAGAEAALDTINTARRHLMYKGVKDKAGWDRERNNSNKSI